MANPVTHFEVLGADADALQRFYSEAFGWQMQDVMGGAYYMVNPVRPTASTAASARLPAAAAGT